MSLSTQRDSPQIVGPSSRADFAGDALHRRQIVRRRRREARLDNIDAQPRQLPRDLQLFGAAQGRAGALLAVAQGGVKEQDYVFVNCVSCCHFGMILSHSNRRSMPCKAR